jgi:hypothetical protein
LVQDQHLWQGKARRCSRSLLPAFQTALIGAWLLILALVAALINQSSMISLIGNGTVYAFIAFTVVGLAVGHVFGGPAPTIERFWRWPRRRGIQEESL